MMQRQLTAVSLASTFQGEITLRGWSGEEEYFSSSIIGAVQSVNLRVEMGVVTKVNNSVVSVMLDAIGTDGKVYAKGIPCDYRHGVWYFDLIGMNPHSSVVLQAHIYCREAVTLYANHLHTSCFGAEEQAVRLDFSYRIFAGEGVEPFLPIKESVTLCTKERAGARGFEYYISHHPIDGVIESEFSGTLVLREEMAFGASPVITELIIEHKGEVLEAHIEGYLDEERAYQYFWALEWDWHVELIPRKAQTLQLPPTLQQRGGGIYARIRDKRGEEASLFYSFTPQVTPLYREYAC